MDWNKLKRRMRGDLVVDVRGFFDADEIKANELMYKGIGMVFRGCGKDRYCRRSYA